MPRRRIRAAPPPPAPDPIPEKVARIFVENINVPDGRSRVDAAKYAAMRTALMKALPDRPPGLTQEEMLKGVLRFLPADLFPGGAKAGWWAKTVQLDLEAKRAIVRDNSKPLRWYRLS